MQFRHISVPELKALAQEQTINIVDTRDPQSYNLAHIPDAFNLNQGNLEQHLVECDMDLPIVVCCYHGISSQGVAQFLVERGFDQVYSLDGGFEGYQQHQQD